MMLLTSRVVQTPGHPLVRLHLLLLRRLPLRLLPPAQEDLRNQDLQDPRELQAALLLAHPEASPLLAHQKMVAMVP